MTQEDEATSVQVIDLCRAFNRRMAEKQAEFTGASVEDIAIGAIYSAVDLALAHTGDIPSAIRWARTALDIMEAGLLSPDTVQ